MSKASDRTHTVTRVTEEGDLHIAEYTAEDCPVHGNSKATGKSFTGSGKAFRIGWEAYMAQANKAKLN